MGVPAAEHRVGRDGAEQGDLVLEVPGDVHIGPAEQHVGLDAQGPQLLHAVLGGLGLQLPRRLDVGHVGESISRDASSPGSLLSPRIIPVKSFTCALYGLMIAMSSAGTPALSR